MKNTAQHFFLAAAEWLRAHTGDAERRQYRAALEVAAGITVAEGDGWEERFFDAAAAHLVMVDAATRERSLWTMQKIDGGRAAWILWQHVAGRVYG